MGRLYSLLFMRNIRNGTGFLAEAEQTFFFFCCLIPHRNGDAFRHPFRHQTTNESPSLMEWRRANPRLSPYHCADLGKPKADSCTPWQLSTLLPISTRYLHLLISHKTRILVYVLVYVHWKTSRVHNTMIQKVQELKWKRRWISALKKIDQCSTQSFRTKCTTYTWTISISDLVTNRTY